MFFTTSSDAKFGYKVKTLPYKSLVQILKYISSRNKEERSEIEKRNVFLQNNFIVLRCVTVGYYSQKILSDRDPVDS